ncbi:H-NS histone family protein [Phaeobacter gallaeciensis]|uniref:H-NS histone family protein n=1 Tax=Rhodobacterales TaxID=204455 RepID=UPI00237F5355|nr:H-NS histone family protein [Phaeobacter gallaeciensis]MDE4201816.1 H-NS histone family protein [Phaeobacter gallaeciensis]MDE4210123.1 H-NS histone family protein [Phaeobacter gallaeciensis]MDE4218486.1 H-NS histone family protein [Phaeobacter gallaeciensis]MDE4222633.1 H-NS histone family protein [Phaeobacter gallaeciensis]MDE4226775.1 H-NS histone family protein [Phaeobacter gallaeciensis]
MTEIDYDKLSLQELEAMQGEVKKAIMSYHNRRKKLAIEKMTALAKELGFSSLSEVMGPRLMDVKSFEVEPVYRNPENPDQTCGNRGRKPFWFKELLSRGYTIEQLRIENQE